MFPRAACALWRPCARGDDQRARVRAPLAGHATALHDHYHRGAARPSKPSTSLATTAPWRTQTAKPNITHPSVLFVSLSFITLDTRSNGEDYPDVMYHVS